MQRSWLDVFADYARPAGATFEDVRRAIALLDERLQERWELGQNLLIAWSSTRRRTQVLALPHYRLVAYVSLQGLPRSGSARLGEAELRALGASLGLEPQAIELPFAPDEVVGPELMGALVQRYGVAYTRDRPVVLVDIVGFSLASAVEQVVLLQSLSHSLNSAYAKLAARNIRVNFARSSTGDGFYIWNRVHALQGAADLYRLMLLMLADNAIAQRKAGSSNIVPRLRTAFHVGPHYEFYQPEGLSPTLSSYLVGEVTITLARLIDGAMPGQVLLGEFEANMVEQRTGLTLRLGTIEFVDRMRTEVWNLSGIPVAGEAVREIRCYLTGPPKGEGHAVSRYAVSDKHGMRHAVFNAKINIHREAGEPIFLGLRDDEVRGLELQSAA